MKRFLVTGVFLLLVFTLVSGPLSQKVIDFAEVDYRDQPPSPTTLQFPAMNATAVTEYPVFAWNEAAGSVSSYRFYLGTDGGGEFSPSDLVDGLDLGDTLRYFPNIELELDQTYYWRVIPTHFQYEDALDCPIWSFHTKSQASDSIPYRQFFEGSNNFTGNFVTSPNGGTQSSGALLSSAFNGNIVSSNSLGPVTNESQLIFDYRLTNTMLGNSVTPNPNFITTYISYDNVNFQAIQEFSIFTPNLNTQYNRVTVDLNDYPGSFYLKFNYNVYFFYDDFFNNNPQIYLDNFLIRQPSPFNILDVSPPTWDAGEVALNSSISQSVTIRNLSTHEVSIQNFRLPINTIVSYFFSLSNYQNSFNLPEGYCETFTVTYNPTQYGNHINYIYYEYYYPDVASPENELMSLHGSCTDPIISNFPYIQDFEEYPPIGWGIHPDQYIDEDGNAWMRYNNNNNYMSIIGPIGTPEFSILNQTLIQFTLSKPDSFIIEEPAELQLHVYRTGAWDLLLDTEDPIYNIDSQIMHYENDILINHERKVSLLIPEAYSNEIINFTFRFSNRVNDSVLIDDFKVYSGWDVIPSQLEEPEVVISKENGYQVLRWEHIDFAQNYLIEATDDISADTWTELTTTPYQGYVYTGQEDYKFFRVKAMRSDE
ncbi:hypothetical protein JEZ13_06815 [bacterium]|nr:hypothetical protein [bacterium]